MPPYKAAQASIRITGEGSNLLQGIGKTSARFRQPTGIDRWQNHPQIAQILADYFRDKI
jgi:hypothetical protein